VTRRSSLISDPAGGKAKIETGSILNIAWTPDGTQLAGAGGNGAVCFGSLLDHTLEWDKISATLEEGTRIRQGLKHITRLVIQRISNLQLLNHVASYDVSMNICQALGSGCGM